MKKLSIFFAVLAMLGTSVSYAEQDDPARQAAVEQAKQDYRVFLDQLKALNSQYREVTNEIKEVIKEEGVPVIDEETGEMVMKKDFDTDVRSQYAQSGPVFGDVDIRENDKDMIVKVDLPGVKKEEIKVKIEDGKVLRIYGKRDNDREDIWNKGYVRTHQSERQHGKFQRRIDLPAMAQDTGIEAQYENGVLTVRIPKLTEAKKEVTISIQ